MEEYQSLFCFGSAIAHYVRIKNPPRFQTFTVDASSLTPDELRVFLDSGYSIEHSGCSTLTLRRPLFETGPR